MLLAIFAKRAQTKDGKVFYNYLSTLKTKGGEEHIVRVKFRDSCGAPKPESCPRNIEVDKSDANLTVREILKDDGTTVLTRTMWVSSWVDGPEYADHSLDEYE